MSSQDDSLLITPPVWELLPDREHQCRQEGCSQVFSNLSHLSMHMRKFHKLAVPKKSNQKELYYCPVERCCYHINENRPRSFKDLQLLRQHYRKVHMDKKFKCETCEQKFIFESHYNAHKCEKFECPLCNLTYGSKAAVLTHQRRKHILMRNDKNQNNSVLKVAIPKLKAQKQEPTSQTQRVTAITFIPILTTFEISSSASKDETETSFNTEPNNYSPSLSNERYRHEEDVYSIDPIHYSHTLPNESQLMEEVLDSATNKQQEQADKCNLENCLSVSQSIKQTVEECNNNIYSNDISIQTEEINFEAMEDLTPLLRNEQTQTLEIMRHQSTMTENHNENLTNNSIVSYEEPMFGTQTSSHMHTQTCDELFEELGLSQINNQTQTNWADDLQNTQYTQTLDEIFDNFQSTYTQTRWLDWQEAEDANH